MHVDQWRVVPALLSVLILLLTACSDDDLPSDIAGIDVIEPTAINTLGAEALSSDSIKLTWTATGDDEDEGTATEYDVRYSTSRILTDTWEVCTRVDSEPSPSAAGMPDSLIVSGLQPSTPYFFAIDVRDEAYNWSTLSNVTVATTLPAEGGK